jgi:alkylation response protein AidB-like acyl-CoA dehydrogenase
VLHEARSWLSYEAITSMVGTCAAERDRDGKFPLSAFDGLRRLRLIANPPLHASEAALLFRVLAAVGRGDLSVGRIFEGHVNALLLIQLFGTASQRETWQSLAARGHIFGVWNTDLPGDPILMEGKRLRGKKTFASGADGLSHAIITAGTTKGRLMIVIPVRDLPVDRSWWRPLGMRASGSHVVSFDGVAIDDDWVLGGLDDYIKEPWFTAGAIRFAAVHVGGMHAVLDAVVTHLRNVQRINDPYQRHRLGKMGIDVEGGYAWLDHVATLWEQANKSSNLGIMATANAGRLAIEAAALSVLESAERGVGAVGMIAPHPLERLIRDLRTYLRQPNPDASLSYVGAAIAEGRWSPGHTPPQRK